MIVGGQNARAYEFPWQVALIQKPTGSLVCGGTIISKQWILTTADCFFPYPGHLHLTPSATSVVVGEYQRSAASTVRRTFNVSSVTFYERFNNGTFENDVALVKLAGNITFTDNIKPVCPPNPTNLYTGRKAQVSGWGQLRYGSSALSDILQYVTLNVTTNSYCQQRYSSRHNITSDMICATDNSGNIARDKCYGDGGGPLTVKESDGSFRVIGVVSWGIECASGYPGVYARVGNFVDWISDVMRTAP
jgi:secreted trypsin-like serine protease